MDYDAQLKLQAYLDGELPEFEASKMAAVAGRDREATALLQELRNTRGALAGFEAEIKLPESREFFWSKIARDIERLETPARERAPLWSFAIWRPFLIPAFALALVFVAGFLLIRPAGPADRVASADSETALADASAFTYRDYSAGTTLVWVSYPADNDVAQDDGVGTLN